MTNSTTEIWKDIPGFEGRYQASNHGRVRSARCVLKQQLLLNGYMGVHLMRDGKRVPRSVHSLVAQTFTPGWFEGAHVNHKDGAKAHNASSNLEWVTRSENMLHACATGLLTPPRMAVVGAALDGSHVVVFASQLAAEKKLAGRASSAVHHCLIGKKKSAYGYVWSRA